MKHTQTGIQIVVNDDKATRLTASGIYKAVPDAQQPQQPTEQPKPPQAKSKPGATDIAAAIAQGAPTA